ncbi:MAG TPA: aldehyde dehydrogenase family protein [Gemmatimonadaceae bacterium]
MTHARANAHATTPTTPRLQPFIAGAFRPAEGDAVVPSVNPSDASDVVALAPEGSEGDARAAVRAAAQALPAWRALAGPARAEHLHAWAAAIATRADELATAMSREVGKPIGEARGEVARCVTILRYYAGEAVREIGEVIPAQSAAALQLTLREPLGVVALITPWNFPLAIPLWKAAPALAFGNTVVLKPSEMSPYMAHLLAETAVAAGLPAGTFNVVYGTGSAVGTPLVRQEDVRGISFTGSSAVGALVARIAAERNVRYQTEMGGKNVAIVMPDADLDLAAALTAAGAMRYAGQKCTATSRVVVAKEVRDPFLARLRAQVEQLPIGPVTDPAAAVGPLIAERARASIRQALEEGAPERLFGGELPADPRFQRGFFFAPLVIRLDDPDAPLARRELFGPVLGAFVADDLDHAIDLANRTPYGLSASLFTRDLRAALHYVRRIEAGLVRVNGDTTGVDPHAPFGGMKGSSSGSREQGPAAREFYTETKTVQINP